MMFADLVDFEDLAGQLKEIGIEVSPNAEPTAINVAATERLAAASTEQITQAEARLKEFQAASDGLILPAAKALLETLLSEISTR